MTEEEWEEVTAERDYEKRVYEERRRANKELEEFQGFRLALFGLGECYEADARWIDRLYDTFIKKYGQD